MKNILICSFVLVIAGCAAKSQIVGVGQNSYLITRQAATGFPGLGNMKAESIAEANQFCERTNRIAQVTNASETKPPYILGNYPRVEVQFTCIAK